jgi:hypothetical protein
MIIATLAHASFGVGTRQLRVAVPADVAAGGSRAAADDVLAFALRFPELRSTASLYTWA